MKHFAIQIYNYNNYKAKMIIQLYLDSFGHKYAIHSFMQT